jgi:hypothetical protein
MLENMVLIVTIFGDSQIAKIALSMGSRTKLKPGFSE